MCGTGRIDLGEPLFTGSSGRVFPKAMKGSPLIRRWLGRLAAFRASNCRTRWRWTGWDDRFAATSRRRTWTANRSKARSNGAGAGRRVVVPGWDRTQPGCPGLSSVGWRSRRSARRTWVSTCTNGPGYLSSRYSGLPVKPAALTVGDQAGAGRVRGDADRNRRQCGLRRSRRRCGMYWSNGPRGVELLDLMPGPPGY